MRRLILVRHCQATGQNPDDPLTAEGLGQAWTSSCMESSDGPWPSHTET